MALVQCSECSKSISDRASSCPHCGAPTAEQSAGAGRIDSGVEQGGTVCPFSGHHIPAGATVCVCNAYYGYKGGILTDQKFKLLVRLLGVSVLLVFFGYLIEWGPAMLIGLLGAFVFGTVFVFFVLPIKLQGQQWWRPM